MKVVNRIKANEEFVLTVKKGKTLKSPTYVIHYLSTDLQVCRIGLSVSKKLGNAVVRNRIKRQMRAMCDALIDYDGHALDVVIIVKDDFLKNNFENNKNTLNNLLSEIGIAK